MLVLSSAAFANGRFPGLQCVAVQRSGDIDDTRAFTGQMKSFVSWAPGADGTEHIDYINSHWSNVEPFTTGFYVNDYFDQTQEQVNRTYRENFPRLLKIKREYDPANLFRLNASIRSAGTRHSVVKKMVAGGGAVRRASTEYAGYLVASPNPA